MPNTTTQTVLGEKSQHAPNAINRSGYLVTYTHLKLSFHMCMVNGAWRNLELAPLIYTVYLSIYMSVLVGGDMQIVTK